MFVRSSFRDWARAIEKDRTAQFELDVAFHLMRDNFYEYEDSNGYHIVLNHPEKYPACHIWCTQVTEEMVANEGLESIRSRVKAEMPLSEFSVGLGIGMPNKTSNPSHRR